ncbi:Tlg2-vesicle protein [Ceratobasidium sp. 392]|nr:Tlg2-vesicle protein [Ceratobasidium sp. 392]
MAASTLNSSSHVLQPPPRTPSPTPSEKEELERGIVNWKKIFRWQTWLKKKYIPWYIGFVVICVLTALMTLYHKQIVEWLRPAANWMHSFSVGWLIPIVVLFVISFPPLFGHEIVAVLCGVVWGLWIGFAIVCAGTLIGEIGNFYAFRYCLRGRAIKMEKKNPSYACLARVVRDGGFLVAFVVRLSAIPGHCARSTSPPQQPLYPPPQQQAHPAQQRYELYDRPVPRHHEQESTIGSYRTAHDGQ